MSVSIRSILFMTLGVTANIYAPTTMDRHTRHKSINNVENPRLDRDLLSKKIADDNFSAHPKQRWSSSRELNEGSHRPENGHLSGTFLELVEDGERRVVGGGGWANMTCDACKVIVRSLQKKVAEQKPMDDIVKELVQICIKLRVETYRVCSYVVNQYSEMAVGIIQGTALDPDDICGVAIGDNCATPINPFDSWSITMSTKPKPPLKPRVLPKPGSPTVRVLHLTDIHIDMQYTPGADALCGEPLCCRAFDTNPAPTPERRAGQWGDYRKCDLPLDTVERLFQHLADIKDQFDYVMFTGDISAHDVWNQTRLQQLSNLQRVSNLFRKYLPNTPVYTTPGNHESVPCDSFPPDTIEGQSMDWLYSAYLQAWGYWLPDSTYQTIMRGGFYTFSPFPGLRIVSLNSNYGSNLNWWLMINNTDPQGQLQWLADVLQQAEDAGEKVHILSHFPNRHMWTSFGLNYYRLINRYECTIVGQFHGHTHKDEYEVFYDLNNTSRPVAMGYIAGSLTPYVTPGVSNPAFRIYTIDGSYNTSSWEVLDYTHYYLNVSKANTEQDFTWEKEYSAKEVYQLASLFPEDWNQLVYRMRDNDTLFQNYYRYYYKLGDNKFCDFLCKRNLLCQIKTARRNDSLICNDL